MIIEDDKNIINLLCIILKRGGDESVAVLGGREGLRMLREGGIFGFGLLHGLGFAGVLEEVGLGSAHFAAGLAAFNVGIELGQLDAIACCFLLLGLWFRNKPWYRQRVVIPASGAVALTGAYWFVERTIDVPFISADMFKSASLTQEGEAGIL